MDEISIAFATSYGARGGYQKYMPLMKKLGDHLCASYGLAFPRGYKPGDEPVEKMHLSRFVDLYSRRIIKPLSSIFRYPNYYGYLNKIKWFDRLFAKKIAEDDSKIVFTSPLLEKTVFESKKRKKRVVLEAGNSEPCREFKKITAEYQKFGIKNRYIYGDHRYMDICRHSFSMADRIITLSDVSTGTYEEAGYDMSRFEMIPLTGTNFEIQKGAISGNKRRAFISVAFHSFIKGTHRLLLAWKKANIKDIPLLIVGELCEDMREFIGKYGPFHNVEFVGYQGNLEKWYRQFDAVGILESLSEGAVRVTPEMMSFGFPMIVSPDATCDIVIDGINGFVVDTADEKALIDKLLYFASDWNHVYQMRESVLKSVKNRTLTDYSLDVCQYLMTLMEE